MITLSKNKNDLILRKKKKTGKNSNVYQWLFVHLISACNIFHALARLSSDFQAATWWCNQHRFTPDDSINLAAEETKPRNKQRNPTSSSARRFPRDCIVFISEGVYLTGWLYSTSLIIVTVVAWSLCATKYRTVRALLNSRRGLSFTLARN